MSGEIPAPTLIEVRMNPEELTELMRSLGEKATILLSADTAEIQPEVAVKTYLNPDYTEQVESNGELIPLITRKSFRQFDHQKYSKMTQKRPGTGNMCWNTICRYSQKNQQVYMFAVISGQDSGLNDRYLRIAGFQPSMLTSLIDLAEEKQTEIRSFSTGSLKFLRSFAGQLREN